MNLKLCEKVDGMSMMKSREYYETKQNLQSNEEKKKEYGGKTLSAPFKLSVANRSETRKKVNRTSMTRMKSREYYETNKAADAGSLFRKNRSCSYFKARSFACQSLSNLCLGLAGKKAIRKYLHRSLWNVTIWRLSGEAGVFCFWLVTKTDT